jgi:excisionase family DNA binding protein
MATGSSVSQQVEGWLCFGCSILRDVDYRKPSAPDVHCAGCGEIANPCAVLRRELSALCEAFSVMAAKGTGAGAGEAMTAEEAVAYLRLPSVRALYQAVRRKQVPVHRLGARMRFDRGELDDVLKRR